MKSIYDDLWQSAYSEFSKGRFSLDPLIDDSEDMRRGLTLIIKPHNDVLDRLAEFCRRAREIEGQQFYCDVSQIHVTVMSIITCTDDFDFDQIELPKYVDQIDSSLKDIDAFNIEFNGITASPSCVLAQGYPSGNGLQLLRKALREKFRDSGLRCSIDERYSIATAHCTLIRFKEELSRVEEFLKLLTEMRDVEFGQFEASKMTLVFNDWYHRAAVVKELHNFRLPTPT